MNTYHFNDLFHFDLQSHFKDSKAPQDEAPIHRIRITLTSRNVKSLEKGNGYLQILNVNARMQPDLQWFFVQWVSSSLSPFVLRDKPLKRTVITNLFAK